MITLETEENKKKETFVPFSITLNVGTRRDAEALYFIFNYLPIVNGVLAMSNMSIHTHGEAARIRAYILKHAPADFDIHHSFEELKNILIKQMQFSIME